MKRFRLGIEKTASENHTVLKVLFRGERYRRPNETARSEQPRMLLSWAMQQARPLRSLPALPPHTAGLREQTSPGRSLLSVRTSCANSVMCRQSTYDAL